MARLQRVLRSGASSPSGEPYCPEAGDIIEISFDPQSGREQAGRRPALVLSPITYNRLTRLCLLCPITNQAKGYPFEVPLPVGHEVTGVVLADQVKCLSWEGRNARFTCQAPEGLSAHTKAKIKALLAIP